MFLAKKILKRSLQVVFVGSCR